MSVKGILGLILGGGRGARLWPLTKFRAKPAVPLAGKYRLVDVPLSNCLNSGIHQVAILTQYSSVSLHRHIAQTYQFDFFHPGWVEILAAEQTYTSADWYQGTADAVRKQLFEIEVTGAPNILVLAGDHLYRMDYSKLAAFHWENEADVTVAVKPILLDDAPRFGILKLSDRGRITDFVEKPSTEEELADFARHEAPELPYLGSMGIYLFRTEALLRLLEAPHDDFGGDVIPAAIQSHRTFGYTFDGYWQDIGTIRSFYDANLALTQPDPPFSFQDPQGPIFTHPRSLPGSRLRNVKLHNALLGDGCIVDEAEIRRSVIGIRSLIGKDVLIEDTIIMGADQYESEALMTPAGAPAMGIGRGSRIRGAIIDKDARIGPGVVIEPFPRGTDVDTEHWCVRDGIVVVPKGTILPRDTRVGP